jgi:hypothetical protein
MTPSAQFRPLLRKPCWNVTWDRHTGLWLDFGRSRLIIREPMKSKAKSPRVRQLSSHRHVSVRGDYTLAIWCGRWSLALRNESTVTFHASAKRINWAVALLDGQKLTRATVSPRDGATKLHFDLGGILAIQGSVCDDAELWTLYKPRHLALTVRADGLFSDGSTSKRDRWQPLSTGAA